MVGQNSLTIILKKVVVPIFYNFYECKQDCQYPGVLACTPDLPLASSEGRGEQLGLRHLEWHNLTLLANFTRHKRENLKYAKASKKFLK